MPKMHNPIAVASALKGISFPCSKQELISHARENDFDDIAALFERLPEHRFGTVADVEREVARIND